MNRPSFTIRNQPPCARPAAPLALISAFALAVPAAAQVVHTATSTGSGSWQLSSIWTVTPGGGAGFPNNTPTDIYNTTVSGGRTYSLAADVTVNSLNVTGNLTVNNSNAHKFTVNNGFTASGGDLSMQSAIEWTLNGSSTVASRFNFANGAGIINNGTLLMNSPVQFDEIADLSVPASGYQVVNNGHVTIDRPGQQVVFQNFKIQNNGQWDVLQQDNVSTESFVQSDPNAIFRVYPGATFSANQMTFTGGTLFASGSRIVGSNFTFKNSKLVIGESLNQVANLTLDGNFSAGNVQDATFRFLIAGSGASQYDTLTIVNGMNFNTVTLQFAVQAGYQIKSSDIFTVITGNNLSSGTFANQVGNKLQVAGLGTFDLFRDNSTVRLSNFVPVPEPEHWAAAAGAVLLGFGLWRRRNAAAR